MLLIVSTDVPDVPDATDVGLLLHKHPDPGSALQCRRTRWTRSSSITATSASASTTPQGKAGRDALAALLRLVRRYVTEHPGCYAATIGEPFRGEDNPFLHAAARLLGSLAAVLGGYGISTANTDHAARSLRCLLHGFAALLVADAFQWDADIDRTFEEVVPGLVEVEVAVARLSPAGW